MIQGESAECRGQWSEAANEGGAQKRPRKEKKKEKKNPSVKRRSRKAWVGGSNRGVSMRKNWRD